MKANCLSLCHFCHFGFNEINTRLQQIITCLHTRSYYSTRSLTHTHRSEHTRTFIVLLQNSTKGRLGTSFRHSSRVRECHEREREPLRAHDSQRERASTTPAPAQYAGLLLPRPPATPTDFNPQSQSQNATVTFFACKR